MLLYVDFLFSLIIFIIIITIIILIFLLLLFFNCQILFVGRKYEFPMWQFQNQKEGKLNQSGFLLPFPKTLRISECLFFKTLGYIGNGF